MPAPAFFQQLGLFVIPDFLDLERRIEICRQVSAARTEKAIVVGPHAEGHVDLDSRRADYCIIPKESRTPLKDRLRELQPALESHFHVTLAGFEPPEYLMYHPGDFFKAHRDTTSYGGNDQIRRRLVSVVIFLNRQAQEPAEDAYGEGDLTFYGLLEGPEWEKCAFPLQAAPGLLIAFPSDKWHEVKPVSHGRRFTAVTWFYSAVAPAEVEGTPEPANSSVTSQ